MKTRSATGVALTSVAICTALLLGTLGWFMVGFGLMTDCTNSYGCTETGCTPCANTENWVNAGGVAQLVLAGMGVVVLVLKIKRRPNLAITGAVLLATSVLTMVGTTWRAQESYCQPDAPGYISSDCSIGD